MKSGLNCFLLFLFFQCQLYQHAPCCKVSHHGSLSHYVLQFTAVLQKYLYLHCFLQGSSTSTVSWARSGFVVSPILLAVPPSTQANKKSIYEVIIGKQGLPFSQLLKKSWKRMFLHCYRADSSGCWQRLPMLFLFVSCFKMLVLVADPLPMVQ